MTQDANTSSFIQVGHIVRSQGLKGELKVIFETESPENVEQLSLVYLRNDRGDFYPCRIVNLRVEGKGNKISFFVQFDHIADRTSAEALRNRALFVDQEVAGQFFSDKPEDDTLLDYEVLNDRNQHVGLIIDLMDSGAQTVLTVATTSGSLLIPLVDEFVVEVNHEAQTIQCQNLEILEDL
ncbi:MAG: 16S rRNA processing protein RimM [Balneolaceae bacterium]|nr:16S rRNA processing protein RimM [Balneolaceae bacterium]MBO6545563.1 16S rRNA processing protein RimM [Balneolaceae bacterium]MBO6646959.1 16S rRNA processing protein RimM [Balneolaceae bacterium]